MLFKIVDHLEVDLHVLVGVEGEFGEQGVEVLHEVAEDGDLGLLLDEGDRLGDQQLLGGGAGDALVDQGEATSGGNYYFTRLKILSVDLETTSRMFWAVASSRAAV
jgi:hypothetical protein